MNHSTEKLKQINQNGYSIDFGEVFNETFENYKKTALLMGVFFLILFVIYIVLASAIMSVFIGVGSYTNFLTGFKSSLETSTTTLIIETIVKIFIVGLLAPIGAGLLKIAHNAEIGEEFGIGTPFEYYKSNHFKEIFISGALISSIMSLIGLATNLFLSNDLTNFKNTQNFNFENIWSIFAFTLIAMFVLFIFTIFTTPLIIFGNLNATEAIKQSFILSFKHFWMILLLLIIAIICCFVGIFGFCIGIFFTLPFYYSTVYIIYKNVVGIESNSELDQIGISNE
jgi:uncharacterized membrane protein